MFNCIHLHNKVIQFKSVQNRLITISIHQTRQALDHMSKHILIYLVTACMFQLFKANTQSEKCEAKLY